MKKVNKNPNIGFDSDWNLREFILWYKVNPKPVLIRNNILLSKRILLFMKKNNNQKRISRDLY